MADSLDRAAELVEQLRAADVRAYIDPAKAAANLPCVLLTPPRRQYEGGPLFTWTLVALAASDVGGLAAWQELDALLDQLDQALHLGAADPGSYNLSGGTAPLPCYLVTYTESG